MIILSLDRINNMIASLSSSHESGVTAQDMVCILKGLKGFSLDLIVFRMSDTGIYVQGMDNSHICLFELQLNKGDFEDFKFSTKKDSSVIAVTSAALEKVLACYQSGQKLDISTKGTSPTDLSFTFSGGGNGNLDKSISIPVHHADGETLLTIPSVEYDVDITISAKSLSTVMEQLSLFGDRTTIKCNSESISFKCSGGHGTIDISLDDDTIDDMEYAIVEELELSQLYNMRFMRLLTSYVTLRKSVYVGLKDDSPLSVRYGLSDKKSYLQFYLAPCIE